MWKILFGTNYFDSVAYGSKVRGQKRKSDDYSAITRPTSTKIEWPKPKESMVFSFKITLHCQPKKGQRPLALVRGTKAGL